MYEMVTEEATNGPSPSKNNNNSNKARLTGREWIQNKIKGKGKGGEKRGTL